jgi:hypothetical protein
MCVYLVGGLEHVLFSISYMGCHPSHWLSYFSRWLKPPTRYLIYLPTVSIWESICLSVYLFINLFIYLLSDLFVGLFIYTFFLVSLSLSLCYLSIIFYSYTRSSHAQHHDITIPARPTRTFRTAKLGIWWNNKCIREKQKNTSHSPKSTRAST